MKKFLLTLTLFCCLTIQAECLEHGLVGFAATPGYGLEGTIGGGLGEIVRVDNEADLRKYCKASGAYTILFEGSIVLSNEQDIQVTSNKSIIGLNGNAMLDGIGFNANGVNNVIIRGFSIKNAHQDAIAFRNSHHVWIDHCDLSASDDGLLDFTIGSDLLTASWNHFHHHDKVSICNSGTQHYEDVGKQNVSYHHNAFISTTQRNPRIGYGQGHVWNNYYESVSSYCVGYFTGARVIVEKNYFKNSKSPLNQMYSNDPTSAHYGRAEAIDNVFSGCSGNMKGTGEAFNAEYYYDFSHCIDEAQQVPEIVKASMGPMSGLEYDLIPLPNCGRIDFPQAEAKLQWSKAPDAQAYHVYLGTSAQLSSQDSLGRVSVNSIHASLKPATQYFWRVDIELADTLLQGQIWHFTTAATHATKPYPADGEKNAQLQAQKSSNSTQPITLTWRPAFGAEGYELMIQDESGEISHSAQLDQNVTAWQAPYLPRGRNYTWSVQALYSEPIDNDDSSTNNCAQWTFSAKIAQAKEGINEAENLTRGLRAYIEVQDGAWFLASGKKVVGGESGPGTINAEWRGERVKADITAQIFDESDGKGSFKLFLNNSLKSTVIASKNNDKLSTISFGNIELRAGDQLRLEIAPEGGEGCRTDYIKIAVTEVINGLEDVMIENEFQTTPYNLMGQPVNEDYEGIIIKNGQKLLLLPN